VVYDNRAGWLQLAIGVCFTEETGGASQSNGRGVGAAEGSSQSSDELVALSRGEEGRRIRSHNVVPVEIDKQSLASGVAVGEVGIRHQEQ